MLVNTTTVLPRCKPLIDDECLPTLKDCPAPDTVKAFCSETDWRMVGSMVVPQRGTRFVGVGEAIVSPKRAIRARRSILKVDWKGMERGFLKRRLWLKKMRMVVGSNGCRCASYMKGNIARTWRTSIKC